MRRPILAVVVATALAGCGGGGSGESEEDAAATGPSTQTIQGELQLTGGVHELFDIGESDEFACAPPSDSGYSDIQEGAQVVVRDGEGSTLATSSLEEGRAYGTQSEAFQGPCVFSFEVRDVPESDFYTIEVSHRGEITYSREELESAGWTAELTLGD